jgi:hypothetical protein
MAGLDPILQVLTILAAGATAVIFVNQQVKGVEERLSAKIDAIHSTCIPRPECAVNVANHERRLDVQDKRLENLEVKIGLIAQKAQILVAERELGRWAANGAD